MWFQPSYTDANLQNFPPGNDYKSNANCNKYVTLSWFIVHFQGKMHRMGVKEHYKTPIKEAYKYKQNYNKIFESDLSSPALFEH